MRNMFSGVWPLLLGIFLIMLGNPMSFTQIALFVAMLFAVALLFTIQLDGYLVT